MLAADLVGTRERILEYLDENQPATPCLVLDTAQASANFRDVSAALPKARIRYAVKACPQPEIVRELAAAGAEFDVASIGEIDLCLELGISADRLCFGNPIKKPRDIARAFTVGVRQFVCDSEADLANLIAKAPGASVECRFLADVPESGTPFGRKFGCTPEAAVALLHTAAESGMKIAGPCFHVGSQQRDPGAWRTGISQAAAIARQLADGGVPVASLNIGGGLPINYREDVAPLAQFAAEISGALAEYFDEQPQLVVEPGRALVGNIGVLRSEVVLVRPDVHGRRWVFLDAGRYNGLAETENEYIVYRLRTDRDSDPTEDAVIAGPTCDGDDVIYQHTPYVLPATLIAGDYVDVLDAGAYTASYSSVSFNGFEPLNVHVI